MNFKPGDLVVVVKPRDCGCTGRLGVPVTVDFMNVEGAVCRDCGAIMDDQLVLVLTNGNIVQPHRVIKIDPLTEQDKTETLQEITA